MPRVADAFSTYTPKCVVVVVVVMASSMVVAVMVVVTCLSAAIGFVLIWILVSEPSPFGLRSELW